MKNFNILVTGTGSLIGQAIIKSVLCSELNKDINIIGCDYFDNTVGSFWCSKNYILPDILKCENKEKWCDSIIKIIQDNNISCVFIGVDFELVHFLSLKSEIEKNNNCKVIVSDNNLLTIGNDKYLTYKFLKDNNLNYPETWLYSEIHDAKIKYPCIVKPRIGARSRGVFIVKNKDELYEKISEDSIVQELIGSNESEYTCGVLYLNDRLISSIALRRYLNNGNTSLAEFKKDFSPSIYKYILRIADILKPYGGCNFQLRLDENDEPYLFEINPRYSGTTYMRSLFGFHEVEYILKHIFGYELTEFNLKAGVALRYYEESLL